MNSGLSKDQLQLKKIISSSDPSFPSTYAFNYLPSRYIHEDWLKQVLGDFSNKELQGKICKSPFSDARLNRLILSQFGLVGQYCYDFDDFARRLALMPNNELQKIIKTIGMIPYVDDLKKIIDKKHVEQIRACIGLKEYRFLITRVPFLLSEKFLSQINAIQVKPFDLDHIEMLCFENGINFLLLWIEDQPLSISQRLRLKLKTGLNWESDEQFKNLSFNNVQTMFKKIIREVVPTWRHLFV